MENFIKIMILAIIGGIIGYITNVIAIKLIFRPIEPIKIPIINKEIIGLIPKRKSEIAQNIGQVIQDELIDIDELIKNVVSENDKDEIVFYIKNKINDVIDKKINQSPLGFMGIGKMVNDFISEHLDDEIKNAVDELTEVLINKGKDRINIQEIVKDKINELDLYKLEEIILSIVKKELKHIETLGLVLGFFIGLVQGIIVIFI